MVRTVAVAFAATLAASAVAQDVQSALGPRIGVFFPSDSRLRDALGDSWVSFGLGAVNNNDIKKKAALDWNIVYQNSRGNRVLILTPSYGITVPLQQNQGAMDLDTQFYVAGRLGVSYIDFGITPTGSTVRQSARRVGFDANVELGVAFGKSWRAAARYDLMPELDGYRFSGLTLTLTYGLFRF